MNNDFVTSAEHLELCKCEVLEPNVQTSTKATNLLDRFSLLGMSGEIAKQILEEVFVLHGIAIIGQLTALYAPPNTGKTLFTLHLLSEGIKKDQIDPAKVYYINVDDTIKGLHEKLLIAEKYGFHTLAEGYKDFSASKFLDTIKNMTVEDKSKGVIIVLDTLKKFIDLMNKQACTEFGKVCRAFVMKGGTLIGLAHTNKNPGTDGKAIHAGTSDIREDFDCAFILEIIEGKTDRTVVEFKNIKKRGNVELSPAFSYSSEQGLSYDELLLSVEKVDAEEIEPMKQKAEMISDSEITDVIEACINEGINTKMLLAEATAERTNISKRHVLKIIDKYTGQKSRHLWDFKVRDRGAKVYYTMYG